MRASRLLIATATMTVAAAIAAPSTYASVSEGHSTAVVSGDEEKQLKTEKEGAESGGKVGETRQSKDVLVATPRSGSEGKGDVAQEHKPGLDESGNDGLDAELADLLDGIGGNYGQESDHASGYGQESDHASGYGQESDHASGYGQESDHASGYGQESDHASGYGQESDHASGYGQESDHPKPEHPKPEHPKPEHPKPHNPEGGMHAGGGWLAAKNADAAAPKAVAPASMMGEENTANTIDARNSAIAGFAALSTLAGGIFILRRKRARKAKG